MPLINSKGHLKRVLGIITLPGFCTGKDEKKTPIIEKTHDDKNIPNRRSHSPETVSLKKRSATITGRIETAKPKKSPTKDFPIISALKGTGVASILSSVFILRSMGSITWPAEDDVKKTVMDISRTMDDSILRCLPTVNEKKRKKGIKNPNMIMEGVM